MARSRRDVVAVVDIELVGVRHAVAVGDRFDPVVEHAVDIIDGGVDDAVVITFVRRPDEPVPCVVDVAGHVRVDGSVWRNKLSLNQRTMVFIRTCRAFALYTLFCSS